MDPDDLDLPSVAKARMLRRRFESGEFDAPDDDDPPAARFRAADLPWPSMWAGVIAAAFSAAWGAAIIGLIVLPFDEGTHASRGPLYLSRPQAAVIVIVVAVMVAGLAAVAVRFRFGGRGGWLLASVLLVLVVATSWFVRFPPGYESAAVSGYLVRSGKGDIGWFVLLLLVGALPSMFVAVLFVRGRSPAATIVVGVVGLSWIVRGSGVGAAPRLRDTSNHLVTSQPDVAPVMLLAGIAMSLLAVAAIVRPRQHPRRWTLALVTCSGLTVAASIGAWVAISSPVQVVGSWVEGRPLRRRRRVVVPRHRMTEQSVSETPGPALSWLRAAAHEKASIYAFEDLACRLSAVEAPTQLQVRCMRASDQEVHHTSLCLSLASRLGVSGEIEDVSVRPLRARVVHSPIGRRAILRRIAREAAYDGMFGEGFAAARLELGAKQASDPQSRIWLAQIAADERSHARLALDILKWCRSVDPSGTRVELLRARRRIQSAGDRSPIGDLRDAEALRLGGFVDGAQAALCWSEIRSRVLRDIDRVLLEDPGAAPSPVVQTRLQTRSRTPPFRPCRLVQRSTRKPW